MHSTRRFGLLCKIRENVIFLIENTSKTRGVKTSSEAQDCGWSVPTAWELRTSCHGNGVSKRFTSLTERSIGAGSTVIIQLSGHDMYSGNAR